MTRLNLGLNRGLAAIYLFFSSDPVLPVCPATEPPPPGHHRAAAATAGATHALDRSHPRHPEGASSADLAPPSPRNSSPRKRPVLPPASPRSGGGTFHRPTPDSACPTGSSAISPRASPPWFSPRPSAPGSPAPWAVNSTRAPSPAAARSLRSKRSHNHPAGSAERKKDPTSGRERRRTARRGRRRNRIARLSGLPLYRRNRRMVDCLAPQWACGGAAGASGAASVLGPKSVVPASARPWRACQPNPALKPRPQEDLPPAAPAAPSGLPREVPPGSVDTLG